MQVLKVFSAELFFAAARADVDKLQMFLRAGVEVNAEDGTPACNTPLHWAASFGSLPCTTALLDAKSDVDRANTDGATSLHEAAKAGHAETVMALLDAKADPRLQGAPLPP